MVVLYLAAIVAANLLTAHFGPSASVANAFLFIGLDLSCRDRLHDSWHNSGLVWKMGTLILAGSLLSWVINRDAGHIAVASCVAFGLAAIADAVVYHGLQDKKYMLRSNGSNIAGAMVDSVVFPVIAFGGFNLLITVMQFAAKVLGGFVWSAILQKRKQ